MRSHHRTYLLLQWAPCLDNSQVGLQALAELWRISHFQTVVVIFYKSGIVEPILRSLKFKSKKLLKLATKLMQTVKN